MSEPSLDEFSAVLDEVLDDEETASEDEHELAAKSQFTFGSTLPEDVLLDTAQEEILQLKTAQDLPEGVAEMATQLFDQFVTHESMNGRAIEPYAAAVVYCACKVNGVPIHPEDVVQEKYDLLKSNHVLRRVKHLASTVGLDVAAFFESQHFVPEYCEELDLPAEIEDRAIEILERCENAGIASGKSPSAWAGAAVYNAALESGHDLTQTQISNVAQTSVVTIRNRYQEQREHIRATEVDGTDPHQILETVSSQLRLDDTVQETATDLLTQEYDSRDDSLSEQRAAALALAAIHIASQQHDDDVGYQVLKQYTTADSSTIREMESRLKAV